MAEEKEIGKITHYFDHLSVAVVNLSAPLSKGDQIHIKGAKTDFKEDVSSMQKEHDQIEVANPGESIGLKVDEKVREGDKVYK